MFEPGCLTVQPLSLVKFFYIFVKEKQLFVEIFRFKVTNSYFQP